MKAPIVMSIVFTADCTSTTDSDPIVAATSGQVQGILMGNGGDLPVWPKFDTFSLDYVQFTDSGPVAEEGLCRPYCDLFIENVKRLMKQ